MFLMLCAAAVCMQELTVTPNGLSPQQALLKIRAAKAAGDKSAWTVRVAKGVYPLTESLRLTPADSGTPEAPVVWQGAGAKSVLAGGVPITGWRDEGNGVWSAPLPKAPSGKPAFFESLWVNGRRADCARMPNRKPDDLPGEYCRLASAGVTCVTNAASRAVSYVETIALTNAAAVQAALAATPTDERAHVVMGVIHNWSFARRLLEDFDAAQGRIVTRSDEGQCSWRKWAPSKTLVFFENVRAGFDAPGEWFYDVKAGRVLYRPLPGETLRNVTILAPSSELTQLVSVQGDPEKGAYVHDIHFRGLRFAVTAATAGGAPTIVKQHQAASGFDAAITLRGAHRLAFENCFVANTGNYGMRINDGCVSNVVRDCTLEDLGAGGIWMGASRSFVASNDQPLSRRVIRRLAPRSTAFNRIENCTIRGGGRFQPEGTGVALTHASDCKVLHCDIYDFYYTGISVGWIWGFKGSVAQRNEIAFNRICDLGKGVMSDMGGVYTLGTSYGTTVHDNVIHDVKSYSYGGWALYCDEGSEDITMTRNLCWNTTDGGFHQHYGAGCFIQNNIFAWNRMLGAVRMQRDYVQDIRCTLNFANNIILVREGPLVGEGVRRVGGLWAANLWWDASGREPVFDGLKGWNAWCATGKECGGRYADPQFVDAEHYDFRLRETSPAIALGFRPWDYSAAGRKQ